MFKQNLEIQLAALQQSVLTWTPDILAKVQGKIETLVEIIDHVSKEAE